MNECTICHQPARLQITIGYICDKCAERRISNLETKCTRAALALHKIQQIADENEYEEILDITERNL
jgi:hypothetical protein